MWRYPVAIILLAHGIGHIMPFMAAWTSQISQVGFSPRAWRVAIGESFPTYAAPTKFVPQPGGYLYIER